MGRLLQPLFQIFIYSSNELLYLSDTKITWIKSIFYLYELEIGVSPLFFTEEKLRMVIAGAVSGFKLLPEIRAWPTTSALETRVLHHNNNM